MAVFVNAIGNAKTLNSDTKNDLLSETHMTSYQYTYADTQPNVWGAGTHS